MSETTALLGKPTVPVGVFAPPPKNASMSPCPVLNALANHGHINRDGRKIYMKDLNASMRHVGMSPLLGSVFAVPTYFEYCPNKTKQAVPFWRRIWQLIKNPYSFFSFFGCWQPRNLDSKGNRFLDLADVASHGAIEHDISLSRRDHNEPEGNNAPQEDLIKQLLDSSSDGEYLTVDDMGRFIRNRIHTQLEKNPSCDYTPQGHQINCGQVALMMHCFGDGKKVRKDWVRAIFVDERLPTDEGWMPRTWWKMGLWEFFKGVKTMQAAVGITF